MTEPSPKSNSAQDMNDKSFFETLKSLREVVETFLLIPAVIALLFALVNGFRNWLEKPEISITWVTVALLILFGISGWIWILHRTQDNQSTLWKASRIVLLFSSLSLALIVGLLLGSQLLPSQSSDNAYFNFEEDEQDWEISTTQRGVSLGRRRLSSTDQAFAGTHSLKFEFSLNIDASTAGVGQINSPYTVQDGDLIIAYLLVPEGSPTNIVASVILYENSQKSDTNAVSQITLVPGKWVPLVWEAPKERLSTGTKLGLKFDLLAQFGGVVQWDDAVVYIDSVQVINQNHLVEPREVVVEPTEETSDTSTATATTLAATPTSPTPTPAHTPTPSSVPLPSTTPLTPLPVAIVNVGTLNLRKGPGIEYDIIHTLTQGEHLMVLGKNPDGSWLKIQTSQGKVGWANAHYTNLTANIAVVPTVSATPTRTWLPTPAPISPRTEYSRTFENEVEFKWDWFRSLGNKEYFSVRVSRQDTGEQCFHDKTQNTSYSGRLLFCNSGKLYWEVIPAKLLYKDPEYWLELSLPSSPQYFNFIKATPVPPTSTPIPPDNGDDGGDGNGDGPICPPPC